MLKDVLWSYRVINILERLAINSKLLCDKTRSEINKYRDPFLEDTQLSSDVRIFFLCMAIHFLIQS